MIAVTKKLHDAFFVHIEAKNSSSGPAYSFLFGISTEKGCQVIAVAKKLIEKCSLSGQVSLGIGSCKAFGVLQTYT